MFEETAVEQEGAILEESVEAEESVETEAQEAAEEPAPSEPEKPRKSGVQRRIDELTREKYQAQEQARLAQAQVEQMRRDALQQQVTAAGEVPFPDPSEFTDVQTYQQAVMEWNSNKQQAEEKAKAEQYRQHQEAMAQQQQAMALNAKIAKAVEKYPDWQQKVFDPSLPSLAQINQAAYHAVTQSDAMDDVAYFLANNPSEIYRFADLSPVQAIKEVARLEMTIKGQAKPATPPPPPPKTIQGQGESETNPAKMTTEEYIAWRNSKDPRLRG